MQSEKNMPPRRQLLIGGTGLVAGLGAAALGFRLHEQHANASEIAADPRPPAVREFTTRAAQIREIQSRQTRELIHSLKAKYENPVFGKVRVWDMIEKLGMCVDASDDSLLLTSQFVHVQQVLERMEIDKVQDPDLFLVALLHDLGKVMLLSDEVPEHAVGYTTPCGEFEAGVGLANVLLQFGHDELIYSRMKDHVPEHIAWTIRYHSTSLSAVEPYMNAQDRENEERYLSKFRVYDQGTKSYAHLPRINLAPYRELIEQTFPHPILI